jgi:TIR domain
MAISEGRDVPTKVFVSYAGRDSKYLEQLDSHLSALKRESLLTIWSDKEIRTGQDWSAEILEALHDSKIIIVLVSADYLASSFVWENVTAQDGEVRFGCGELTR